MCCPSSGAGPRGSMRQRCAVPRVRPARVRRAQPLPRLLRRVRGGNYENSLLDIQTLSLDRQCGQGIGVSSSRHARGYVGVGGLELGLGREQVTIVCSFVTAPLTPTLFWPSSSPRSRCTPTSAASAVVEGAAVGIADEVGPRPVAHRRAQAVIAAAPHADACRRYSRR